MTITNCNYFGNNLFIVIQQSLGIVYSFPPYTNIAVFIGVTSDFQAHNVIVRNTTGMGIVASTRTIPRTTYIMINAR